MVVATVDDSKIFRSSLLSLIESDFKVEEVYCSQEMINKYSDFEKLKIIEESLRNNNSVHSLQLSK